MLVKQHAGPVARGPACGARQAGACSVPQLAQRSRQQSVARRRVVAAAADDDAELEKRLEKLRLAKGATPYGQGKAAKASSKAEPSGAAPKKDEPKPVYDFADEKLYYEGGPHAGDLAINIALGATLVWLPLTLGAIGRAAFLKYRFTDKRFSVQSTAPWRNEQTDVAYQEVKEVRSVARGVGLWGDMVVVLRNGDKVELRSLDRYKELGQYILDRRDALGPASSPSSSNSSRPKGAQLTAAELMGEAEPSKTKPKGFA